MPYFRVFTHYGRAMFDFKLLIFTPCPLVLSPVSCGCAARRTVRENFLRAVHPKVAKMKGQWPSVGGGEEREGNETPCLQAYHIHPEREII